MTTVRALLLVVVLTGVGCGRVDVTQRPTGPVGELVSYGHHLFTDTHQALPQFAKANMSCEACHTSAGTVKRGGSLIGVAAAFPQYNRRAKRVISLQDRVAECFLYSMNGRPPAYNSREMEAIAAYITWLSRGTPIGAERDPNDGIARLPKPAKVDAVGGGAIYRQRCSACHQANGAGISEAFPPLWGATSFNDGAGMHRLAMMAGFVKYNMPQSAPNSLSVQEAYDVAAFILSHPRPKFKADRSIAFPATRAGYF